MPVSRSRSHSTTATGDVALALVPSLDEIPAAAWNALVDDNDPFLEHAFLHALERSGSVGRRAGWLPSYLVARDAADPGALLAAVPLYLKSHSYGEFIFDWGWASSASRAGIAYYPKLVAAAPFTPATGQRLLTRRDLPSETRASLEEALCHGLLWAAEQLQASSVHVLFCTPEERARLGEHGFSPRMGLQFHWLNRTPGPYRDFGDFLSAFRSRNRKQVRHERAIAAGHGLRLATRTGPELNDAEWAALEAFYEANIEKHDGARYLTPAFFKELRTHLADRVVATFAYDEQDRPVAGTLNFQRGQHLYGRYWGALLEREMLHFELCYYQLIDHAVRHGMTRFEAGAQGEHKLKRGLDAAPIYSAHLIRHPGLAAAVDRFVKAEEAEVREEIQRYKELSPYARAATGVPSTEPSP